ncbi:dynein heavy chain domain-containing protein 1 [Cololabis saira]|uniref:dynein heavy chain domain-containing protein 1 n=1 Tax=Cololabis saira TaxID=129043 RepID=UPI002AD46C38|nr:dynein heavy chain domain-containing protein 1 [Cololabis saira]
MRFRSRTICLYLAFIAVFFHLFLAFFSLSIHHSPCDPPLPARTNVLKDLAHINNTLGKIRDPAEPQTGVMQSDSSYEDPKKDAKGHVQTLSDKGLSVKGFKKAPITMASSGGRNDANRTKSLESDLLKLEALFDHPLYNIPMPAIPEVDWLLKVKPKVKPSEANSDMWVSASQEGYDDVQWNSSSSSHPPWLRFHLGITRWQLFPHRDPNIELLIQQIATQRIVSAVQKSGGTQLKLVMSFPNYGQALFKPMKQERNEESNLNLYYFSDFERHNAEISAFHLDRILGYRRVPPAVGRLVDVIKEIKDVTTDRKLARTFFTSPVGNECFYGVCSYYCSTEHAVCGRPQDLEASLAVMLPDPTLAARKSWRSPWRRAYSRSKLANLEGSDETVSRCKGKKTLRDRKRTKPNTVPLTGIEVFHILTLKRNSGVFGVVYFLKEVDGDTYRPYDLQVVDRNDAGSEHYMFSVSLVIHVKKTESSEVFSLEEWFTECSRWKALQKIPFFRDFRLRKAFTSWLKILHMRTFQQKCKNLQHQLLIDVPQFRSALHLFISIIEEVKGTHWMPLDESKTYTLLEFKNTLANNKQECLLSLQKLSHYHTVILNGVKEESYKTQQDLQQDKNLTKMPCRRDEPIHVFLAHERELKKKMAHSESILRRLGHFAELIHQLIKQSLVTVIQQDAMSFISLVKRMCSQQSSLFHTELCFSANSQLTVDPPVHVFQETVSDSLLTAGNSIIQMCDNSGLFLEVSNNECSSEENNDWVIGKSLGDISAHRLVPPEETFLKVKGTMVRGSYCPLSKTQLEWHININDVTKRVETEQAKIMQEAELEIQQVCKSYAWLEEIHLFVRQWSAASLETLKGQPASVYEEHITKLPRWVDRIYTVDSSISISNQLFNIHCTHTKEILGHQLSLIENQVLEQLVEQIKLLSETLRADMERAAVELKMEPQGLHDFSKYAFQVRETGKLLPDLKKRLDYILSLQTCICTNTQKMTEQELTLEPKMLGLWDYFNRLLEQAENHISHRLPSSIQTLETMFASLACEFKNIVLEAASGPYLDTSQNASDMVSKLNHMCARVLTLRAQLEEVNRSSQNLQEHGMDMTFVTRDFLKVIARKELWQLKADYTSWLEKWKRLLFTQDVVSEAQREMSKWKEQVMSLTNIPTDDPVVQESLGVLESLSHQVEVMAKLFSTTIAEKHWKNFLQGTGLEYFPGKKVTVAEIIPQQHEAQKRINNICIDAQKEWNMTQTFQKFCLKWTDRLFQLDKFSGTAEHVPTANQHCCLKMHFAEAENDLMSLSTMLSSPHSFEFRLQLEDWVRSLQELGELLDLFESYQEMWAFLTKVFCGNSFRDQKVDLWKCFQPVDETFEKIMQLVSADLHVLNFVFTDTNERFDGNSFRQILMDSLSVMETIFNQMQDVRHTFCDQFPRLWFLSDREVMQLMSCHPTPFTLQPFVRKCFKGVCWLEVEVDCELSSNTRNVETCETSSENSREQRVLGIFGALREHIAFQPPLEKNPDALVWLCDFEKQLKLTMMQLVKQCAVVRNQLEPSNHGSTCDKTVTGIRPCSADKEENVQAVLDMVSEYPLQCVLVVEEALWCSIVVQAFQEKSPVQLRKIYTYNCEKLKMIANTIRDTVIGSKRNSIVSKYSLMCLRALVQLTMNHALQLSELMKVPCALESSFEWSSTMKYHLNSQDGSDDLACYVDVLGHCFQYGFEYSGPEEWNMVHTPSTDRAILGIVLALSSHRCGFVSGPSMSGKTNTVIQLGKALGQHVVVKNCYPSTRLAVVQQMLLAALNTGAWLLLENVDFLQQGVLSSLGQLLMDIHQSFYLLRKNKEQRPNEQADDKTAESVKRCTNLSDSECLTLLSGKQISPNPSYGCVLISSKAHTSEIPESLRFATRSIALIHPDCRIIAEVMLTSVGFSEAKSLSHRLVSLISLAKDSKYLPGFFTDEQSLILGVLKKIICASEIYFQLALSEKEISNDSKVSRAGHCDPTSLQNVCVQPFEKDKKESAKPSKIHISLTEETAIVKAILSVLIPNNKKASQLSIIIKETFPIASKFPLSQQFVEAVENNQLQDAVREKLQEEHLFGDTEIICNALALYQTLKFSQAVILIGPSGSGKTTCYSALAGALNRLAFKAVEDMFENETISKSDMSEANPLTSTVKSCAVDTLVLFPNAMSHEELFGSYCEKRGWKDGAVAKVLRDSEQFDCTCSEICNNERKSEKWLIMDGEPFGQPGWLDYLTAMLKSHDSALCLSSGEPLLSHSHLHLLMEMTDLQDATPSAVTSCSLVYFTGTDLWKAVWKKEINSVCFEHQLDQGIVKTWHCLADDLFSNTVSLLDQHALTSANNFERGSCKRSGIQEVMSVARILRALLKQFGEELEKPPSDNRDRAVDGINVFGSDGQSKQELLFRNLFLVAYIWGFGGHLHYCHWPQFEMLARQVLSSCSYKIVVPDEDSVFEHFFGVDSKMCPKNTELTSFIAPKYGKYRHLLYLMSVANQPVLLAGEPGSGKTTICKTLLDFLMQNNSLPSCPVLSSRDLRIILDSIPSQKNAKYSLGSTRKQPSLLLFVDDLHEAPRDVFGKTSTALETLRQSVSKGEIQMFDTYSFKSLSSAAVGYIATCCISELSNPHSVISSRLSRLFSIFVLPSLSTDLILSIHSPSLNVWLNGMPPKYSDLSNCIITATKHLCHAVWEQFQPNSRRPYFIFSQHDLQKVFSAMCLWMRNTPKTRILHKNNSLQSGTPAALPVPPAFLPNMVKLWMHECMRTFGDRLCSEDERKTLMSLIVGEAETHYGSKMVDKIPPDSLDDSHTVESACVFEPIRQNLDTNYVLEEPKAADQSKVKKGHALRESSPLSERLCSDDLNLTAQPVLPQIFQDLKEKLANLVYGPELLKTLNFLVHQHNFRAPCYYQEQDLDLLLEELCVLMDKKEEDERKKDNYVCNIVNKYTLHREGLSQLLHILRALLIPKGHGVLISSNRGTGRKTTVRLAACLTRYHLIEVHSGNEDKLHTILREAGNKVRVDGVVILVHEEVSLPVREELLVAMAQCAYPALYTEDELRRLVSRLAGGYSRKYHMDCWMRKKSLSQAHRNIHVFLLMPANNETQSSSAQMAKAIRLSSCVEVYQPWSKQSLVETAVQRLKPCPHEMIPESFRDSLSVAMAGIHQSACQYASVGLGAQPFSPRTYMEFIAHFENLCEKLHKQAQSKTNRFSTALARLEAVNKKLEECKEHVLRLRKMLAIVQQLEKELLGGIEDQKNLLKKDKILVEEKEIRPEFGLRIKILKRLKPPDLEEVRHYRNPPEKVVKVMDAICFLFNRPPGWESAKQLLKQTNFLQELEFFDGNSLTNEQLQQLGQIVRSPEFVPESVREVSKACESLCRWVQAVHKFCSIQYSKKAYQRLEDAKTHLQLIQNELKDLQLQLQKAESEERQVVANARQMEMLFREWRAACEEAALNHQSIAGDSLILAAIISYLGPFQPDIRTELLSKWKELCQTGSININSKDLRSNLSTHADSDSIPPVTGFPIATTERLQLPIGRTLGMKDWQIEDTLSSRLVVELLLWSYRHSSVQRWPLLADIKQHLQIISKNRLIIGDDVSIETVVGFEMVVCADDLELLDKLDKAAEKGWKVLLTHVERAKPSPGFLAKLARPAGCCFPGSYQHPQAVHPEFRLFLCTDLPLTLLSSEIHASILTEVDVVDLSLSSKELQELMLTQLLQSEGGDLLTQLLRFQNDNQSLREKLVTEEDALRDYVLQSDILLIKYLDFPVRVAGYQEEMKTLQAKIKQLSKEQEQHESLLAAPHKLIELAAALYQALQVVSSLSPAYYFPLPGFITVIKESFCLISGQLLSCMTGKADENMLLEVMNMMVLQLLVQYRPLLFKNHAAVLELLVSQAVLKYNPLSGVEDRERPVTEVKPHSFSGTVSQTISSPHSNPPTHIHSDPLYLNKISSSRGLIASLCSSPIPWQEYLHFTSSSVVNTDPCCSQFHFSLLQWPFLWKTISLNCLDGVGEAIEAFLLSLSAKTEWAESPHTGNPDALSRYLVKFEGPIILTLPNPERGAQISSQPLHLINQLASFVANKNEVLVKLISCRVLCDRDLLLSVLDKAINDGHWLVFNNCHLFEHWDDKIVARLSQLMSSFREEQTLIHPSFRLWFVTQENASHSVPAAVRMQALRLVCDSPWDLKEELSCSLQHLMFSQTQLNADNVKLFLCCALFHSVLLQRQTYKYLGHGRACHWSQEDFLALVDACVSFVSGCHDKTKVLQHIAVSLIHGGHVMDSTDLDVMESVTKFCFPEDLTPSKNLSSLLQALDQYFQDAAVTDHAMLGFGVDVAYEITKIKRLNLNLFLKTSQTPQGTVGSFSTEHNQLANLPGCSLTRDRLRALKNNLAHKKDSAATNVGAVSCSPLLEFLQAEWDDLFDSVSSLLSQLQQPVQYMQPFASPINMTELSRLEKKGELLSSYLWQDSTSSPFITYQLSAFKQARAIFVALMTEAAEVNHKYVSDIVLQFQVICRRTYPAWLYPGTLYLSGLELRGASWDKELGALQDTLSTQPFLMPPVCVKAQVRSTGTATDSLSCESSQLMDTGDVQASGVSPLITPQLPVYHCPLYLDEEWQEGNGGLTDINVITKIPLYTKLSPVLCSLRRVRLVSTLQMH